MRGAGMIEVMISILIMAIGLLGIAAMQATALRNSQSALERSQGVINTYTIIDSMRANLDQARLGAYNVTCGATAGGGTLASNDIAFWLGSLEDSLGEGTCGAISCVDGSCEITVTWDDTRGTGGVGDLIYSTEVVL